MHGAVRLQGPQVAWGPGVGQLQMSFFYVPLFLCGLSRVAGAPPAGYLRAQDVLQWQQIVEEIYSRPAVQDEIRSVTGVALPTPLNLSFDRLVLGVTTVILHVFGDLGDARAIYNAVVRRSDGYVSEENQVSVMSPSDPAIYAVLAHAWDTGVSAPRVTQSAKRPALLSASNECAGVHLTARLTKLGTRPTS